MWHDHNNAEGHFTLLASVAFSTKSISIGRLVVQEIHLIQNRLKNEKKTCFRFMNRMIDGQEKDRMCMLGMSFHAIIAHFGDETCNCKTQTFVVTQVRELYCQFLLLMLSCAEHGML